MSGEDDFTPKLGRIGDRGGVSTRRASREVRRLAARMTKAKRAKAFTGKRIGAGAAAARMAVLRSARLPKFRMRRVTVKVFIARAARGGGRAAFGAHLGYIEREGVARDRAAGRLYERGADEADADAFRERSLDDPRQFRLIVSPEDGDRFDDFKETTRSLMARVETDLGVRLDWVAVDHFNTGHPHTHIVIRGKDISGKDLIIARDYMMEGLRHRVSDLMTERLGPRRDLEILQARGAEIDVNRFTSIDRELAARARDGAVDLRSAETARDRFERTLEERRLRHLESLALASRHRSGAWRLAPGWEETLQALARRDDIVRRISSEMGRDPPRAFKVFDPSAGAKLIGEIVGQGLVDELHEDRFLIVKATDGKTWYAEIGSHGAGSLPATGGIVEIGAARIAPRKSDRTIARIAAANGGLYSGALHETDDPYSTPEFRAAHKRRLEALRRAGLIDRSSDGAWRIDRGFVERAAEFDRHRNGALDLRTLSFKPLDQLVEARAVTWLDDVESEGVSRSGFGGEVRAAQQRRLQWLSDNGLLAAGGTRLSAATRARLDIDEMAAIGAGIAKRDRCHFVPLMRGAAFTGTFERTIDGASRRFSLIGGEGRFTIATWRPEMNAVLNRTLTVRMKSASIEWTLGRGIELGL